MKRVKLSTNIFEYKDIFNYLLRYICVKSLKNMRRVCKNFADIILKWMQNNCTWNIARCLFVDLIKHGYVPYYLAFRLDHTFQGIIIPESDESHIILPQHLHSVTFGPCFNQKITLPPNVQTIVFGMTFNQYVIFPETVKTIVFGDRFNQGIRLPKNLQSITFGSCFLNKIALPKRLKEVTFHKNYPYLEDIKTRYPNLKINVTF